MILKELRKAKGISQDELSRLSGVNKMQISRIERGDTDIKNMTLINALRISDALGVDPHVLIMENKAPRNIDPNDNVLRINEDPNGKEYI